MAAMADTSPPSGSRPKAHIADLILGVGYALSLTTTLLILAAMPMNRHFASSRDFVVYWATGQQLAHHSDPYDATQVGQVERAGGFDRAGSFYARNPPWSLPLMYPLGFVRASVAALPWSLMLIGLLVFSVRLLQQMFGPTDRALEWIGYCFPPALQCVIMGQTSLFLLAGLVLFQRFHRTRPFWAGAGLWLCTLKPHLFVPFAFVLLVWIAVTRNWRILLGLVAAMAVSCAAIEAIDPAVWKQYARWAETSGISHEAIPTLAVALRNLIRADAAWLIFVPCAAASIWALRYFFRRRTGWDWTVHGNLLMLVSILAAPYCWVLDQSVLLPAILYAAWHTKTRAPLVILGAILLALQLQPLFFSAGLNSPWYLWPAPVWLAWYLWARKKSHATERQIAMPAALAL